MRVGACETCRWAAGWDGECYVPYSGRGRGTCTRPGKALATFTPLAEPRMDLPVNECWERRESE